MPNIGSDLGLDLQMTSKRKNNYSNVISVPKIVKKDVLHQILSLLFKNSYNGFLTIWHTMFLVFTEHTVCLSALERETSIF